MSRQNISMISLSTMLLILCCSFSECRDNDWLWSSPQIGFNSNKLIIIYFFHWIDRLALETLLTRFHYCPLCPPNYRLLIIEWWIHVICFKLFVFLVNDRKSSKILWLIISIVSLLFISSFIKSHFWIPFVLQNSWISSMIVFFLSFINKLLFQKKYWNISISSQIPWQSNKRIINTILSA